MFQVIPPPHDLSDVIDKSPSYISATTQSIELVYYVDDVSEWFRDGLNFAYMTWGLAASMTQTEYLPGDTQVLALIASHNNDGFGIMVWMSNGIVSDTSWKCTDVTPADDSWMYIGFDDSSWPHAVVITEHYTSVTQNYVNGHTGVDNIMTS